MTLLFRWSLAPGPISASATTTAGLTTRSAAVMIAAPIITIGSTTAAMRGLRTTCPLTRLTTLPSARRVSTSSSLAMMPSTATRGLAVPLERNGHIGETIRFGTAQLIISEAQQGSLGVHVTHASFFGFSRVIGTVAGACQGTARAARRGRAGAQATRSTRSQGLMWRRRGCAISLGCVEAALEGAWLRLRSFGGSFLFLRQAFCFCFLRCFCFCFCFCFRLFFLCLFFCCNAFFLGHFRGFCFCCSLFFRFFLGLFCSNRSLCFKFFLGKTLLFRLFFLSFFLFRFFLFSSSLFLLFILLAPCYINWVAILIRDHQRLLRARNKCWSLRTWLLA
mmetsp:Transcript_13826/g.21191  ORF Transcript_13826/g.21191 Transcript_13826/m.21191 type:complete len:335 (+) Transcript_13826:2490-3494(+)